MVPAELSQGIESSAGGILALKCYHLGLVSQQQLSRILTQKNIKYRCWKVLGPKLLQIQFFSELREALS